MLMTSESYLKFAHDEIYKAHTSAAIAKYIIDLRASTLGDHPSEMYEALAHDKRAGSYDSSSAEDDAHDTHGPDLNMQSQIDCSRDDTLQEPSALKETGGCRKAASMPSYEEDREKPSGLGENELNKCVQRTCSPIGPRTDAALAAVLLGDILRPSDGREHWIHSLSEQELPAFYSECEDLLNSLVPRRHLIVRDLP